ncbi:hypothetical protein FJU30_17840 [Affinibrenneria salicis]|uniref:OmpR/PhoB-type domain-containing protein n=1 Tax=Affinibrenneria salicis TaxID=2590031 RepID=A0A5J5FVJ4_9GAMM|nr:winged helix-turn-helix domain-containing protein [Affinibrenneria salicis]KAA8997637.1 hypothetical protein FJU30_17840 [Affinibrenneria salicis]
MVYLINKTVIFSEKDNTLSWFNRQDETVSLSLPVAKLLNTLLNNPGVTLSKEFLLSEVLEKNALAPSLNNLNNYISLLRKSLRDYELAERLMTVPKMGIIFNAEEIEILANETLSPVFIDANATPPHNARKKFWWCVFFAGTGITVVLALSFYLTLSGRFPQREIFRDYKVKKCQLYYLDDDLPGEFPERYNDLCQDNVKIYYYTRIITIPKIVTREEDIIIVCKFDGKRCSTYVYIKS